MEQRSAIMRRIRSRNTGPEMLVRRLLHQRGYRFRLHDRTLPGCPDIVLGSRKSVVFVHGCYWHQHSRCADGHVPKSHLAYWKPKLERTRARDKLHRAQLKKLGWRCLVVWECQLSNESRLVEALESFLG
jgi:DNA mismatch endonuclease Vsr